MNEIEFLKGMKILQSSYRQDFSEDDIKIWYMQFNNIPANIFYNAITDIIRTSRYMPSISDILNKCEEVQEKKRFTILEFMKSQNYFKTSQEYDKATQWLNTNIIPGWFKQDMKKYQQLKIENKNTILLENK